MESQLASPPASLPGSSRQPRAEAEETSGSFKMLQARDEITEGLPAGYLQCHWAWKIVQIGDLMRHYRVVSWWKGRMSLKGGNA